MKKTSRIITLWLALLIASPIFADPSHITGRIVNGRGGTEKCDGLKVKLYLNSTAKALAYTDETGAFSFDITGIADGNSNPGDFALDQNYPNPFNEITTLPYSLDEPGAVTLDIYDIRGHKVRSLVRDHREAGRYYPVWDGRNDLEQFCPQGIYFSILKMNGRTEMKKMTLMSGHMMMTPGRTLTPLAKSLGEQVLEFRIEGGDIENRIVTRTYSLLPENIDLGNVPVHVYAHLRTKPDSLPVLEGQDVRDTLDIYFENEFTLSSGDLDLAWAFNPDSTVSVLYKNVTSTSATLRINEIGESYSSYSKVNFALDQRAAIWPKQLRRAYPGIPYAHDIKIEDARGELSLTLTSSLPSGFSLNGKTLSGTAIATSGTMLYFDLLDDRQVVMKDSALLLVSNPEEVSFNDYVVDVLEEYHRDGRYPYNWVSGYHGVTRDLYYKNTRIAKANADSSHSTYCSGITFEIYFRSMKRLNRDMGRSEDINGMSASNFSDFISKWFVQSTLGDGPGIALEAYGLGEKIPNMQDVIKGDFVQIWRTSGSGHSVIFMNWTTNSAGDTTGMRYWSTQSSTNGVNYNTEYFSGYGGNVDKAHTYYSRGRKPEDFKDY
jgi:hypothetical protein